MKISHWMRCAIALVAISGSAAANEVLSVAVFNFESTDEAVKDLGPKVSSLVTAGLSADPGVVTVERAELEKVLGETELGLSGTIEPATAARVGHLTGAKVLVTGRVFSIDHDTIIVAKIIGTETSRVFGEMVKGQGRSSVGELATQLTTKIGATITKQSQHLVAKGLSPEERIEKLKLLVKKNKLPAVSVKISERHFGGRTHDPAAETEMAYILQQCGFTLADEKSSHAPNVIIEGEAISEFGARKGTLVSCKGRVELKVRDIDSGNIICVDRETSVVADLSEQMAAKAALQQAAQKLAERVLPKLAK